MIRIPHLETDITQACQLSCVACNHSVPLWRARKGGPWHADPKQVETDLTTLARFVHTDRWGALGGEPLLSKHLIDILWIARQSQIADRTEVWTNGLLLPRMSAEFWKSFDILVLSIYPGKHSDAEIEWITKRCLDTGVSLVVKDERLNPNFKTMLEPEPTNPLQTADKFARCFFRGFSRVANYGYFFTCCCAPHLPMLYQGQSFGTDGIKISDATEVSLAAYLNRKDPLGACSVCAGRDTAQNIQWREERDPVAWLSYSKGQHPTIDIGADVPGGGAA